MATMTTSPAPTLSPTDPPTLMVNLIGTDGAVHPLDLQTPDETRDRTDAVLIHRLFPQDAVEIVVVPGQPGQGKPDLTTTMSPGAEWLLVGFIEVEAGAETITQVTSP